MSRKKLFTSGGYPLDEVVSALQKTIRRGLEVEAVFWAQEMESRFYRYLWKRLQIISHEDIGPGNSMAALMVRSWYEQYMQYRKEGYIFKLAVIHAVIMLCRSPKSRVTDHIASMVYLDNEYNPDIPDYALDKHTGRGRRMGRDLDHFYEHGAVIHPDAGDTEYLQIAWDIDKNKKPREWLAKTKDKIKTNGAAKEIKDSRGGSTQNRLI